MGSKPVISCVLPGFVPKMHTPQSHWAIPPSGCRSGSIWGVKSHAWVSSSFLAALLYLPCVTAVKQSRHLQSALCADLDILPARLQTEVPWSCFFQNILTAFLLAQDHGQWLFPSHGMGLQGAAGRGQIHIFLFYSSKRPLADMMRHSPGTCNYSNIVPVPVASHGATQYDPSTPRHLPNECQIAQMTSQEHRKDKMRGQYCT